MPAVQAHVMHESGAADLEVADGLNAAPSLRQACHVNDMSIMYGRSLKFQKQLLNQCLSLHVKARAQLTSIVRLSQALNALQGCIAWHQREGLVSRPLKADS